MVLGKEQQVCRLVKSLHGIGKELDVKTVFLKKDLEKGIHLGEGLCSS